MPRTLPYEEMLKERAVPITTTIPYSKWIAIKESKESWNGLILRGWEARNGFENLTKRTSKNEENASNQAKAINRMQQVIFDLNDKIDSLNKQLEEARK